jgi:hypothetical protein
VIVVFGDAVGVPGMGNALIEPVASNAAGRGSGSGRAELGTGGVVVVVDAAPALGAAAQPTAPTESVPTSAARPRRLVHVIVCGTYPGARWFTSAEPIVSVARMPEPELKRGSIHRAFRSRDDDDVMSGLRSPDALVALAEKIERDSRDGEPVERSLAELAGGLRACATDLRPDASRRTADALTRMLGVVDHLQHTVGSGRVQSISGLAAAARRLAGSLELPTPA